MKIHCLYDKLVQIKDLKSHPKNRNKHPEDQLNRLAQILDYQGWRYPVKVSKRSGFVTSGHGRIEAARLNKWKEVPVNFQDYESDEQEYSDVQADNAIASWAELDLSGINSDIGELGPDFNIDLLGIKDFVLEPADKLAPGCDEDEIPEQVEPRSKLGDIYQLGSHRLMCGDSTSIDAVEKLMNGAKATASLTDPPYNVGINYGKCKDNLSLDEYKRFSIDWSHCARAVSGLLLFTPGTGKGMGMPNLKLWFDIEPPHWVLIWIKKNTVGHSSIGGFNAWEPLFLYGKPKKRIGQDIYDIPLIVQKDAADEKGHKLHPVPKQIRLWEELIKDFTEEQEIIYEPFGGSGTTAIACEKTNRKCFMMEIDPHYCDVIVARWEKYTRKKAELLNREESDGAA